MAGALLPLALVVAISPTTITVLILILLSGRRGLVSVVFAAGYTLGILLDVLILLGLGGAAGLLGGNPNSGAVAWLQLVVGILLVLLGIDEWSKRPKAGESLKPPKWMAVMDDFTPVKSAAASLALASLRPKNVLMFAGASVAIAAGELGLVNSVISIGLFTLISASTVLALVIAALIRQEKITPWLTDLRTWLEANTKAMMSVVLVVVGVVEIGKGIGGIF